MVIRMTAREVSGIDFTLLQNLKPDSTSQLSGSANLRISRNSMTTDSTRAKSRLSDEGRTGPPLEPVVRKMVLVRSSSVSAARSSPALGQFDNVRQLIVGIYVRYGKATTSFHQFIKKAYFEHCERNPAVIFFS